MADREPKPTREELLAAKLRENLKRRKAQARELSAAGQSTGAGDCGALPKAAEDR
jgi:hypothetical protein